MSSQQAYRTSRDQTSYSDCCGVFVHSLSPMQVLVMQKHPLYTLLAVASLDRSAAAEARHSAVTDLRSRPEYQRATKLKPDLDITKG